MKYNWTTKQEKNAIYHYASDAPELCLIIIRANYSYNEIDRLRQ